jgi:hypothetical protein
VAGVAVRADVEGVEILGVDFLSASEDGVFIWKSGWVAFWAEEAETGKGGVHSAPLSWAGMVGP